MQVQRAGFRLATVMLAAWGFILAAPLEGSARGKPVEGNWRGNGRAMAQDGKSYKVRCRVLVQQTSGKNFLMSGKCTSTKGTNAGQAKLKQVSASTFRGTADGMSQTGKGKITVTVNGRRMSLRIRGKTGRLSVNLRKTGK